MTLIAACSPTANSNDVESAFSVRGWNSPLPSLSIDSTAPSPLVDDQQIVVRFTVSNASRAQTTGKVSGNIDGATLFTSAPDYGQVNGLGIGSVSGTVATGAVHLAAGAHSIHLQYDQVSGTIVVPYPYPHTVTSYSTAAVADLAISVKSTAPPLCTDANCGSDGTQIIIARDWQGHVSSMTGVSKDRVTHTLTIGSEMYEAGDALIKPCLAQCPPGQVQTDDGRCGYQPGPTGMWPLMPLCRSGQINTVSIGSLDYSDSKGAKLSQVARLAPFQSTIEYSLYNGTNSASITLIQKQGLFRLRKNGVVTEQQFAYDPDQGPPSLPNLTAAFPELSGIFYFGNVIHLIYDDVQVPLPPQQTSPGWFRFAGDGLISGGFGTAGWIAAIELGPFGVIIVGALFAASIDKWQADGTARDKSWESFKVILCTWAHSLDELDSLVEAVPKELTVAHAYGCD